MTVLHLDVGLPSETTINIRASSAKWPPCLINGVEGGLCAAVAGGESPGPKEPNVG